MLCAPPQRRVSVDEHRIAVAEKAVTPGDRFPINLALFFQAGHGRDQRDQRAAGKMEIRDKSTNVLPGVWGINED